MNTSKPFVKQITFIGLLPVLFVMVFMVIGFIWIQHNQLKNTRRHFVELLENSINRNVGIPSEDALLLSLKPLLTIDPIRHISVMDEQHNILVEQGLPISTHSSKFISLDPSSISTLEYQDEFIIAVPFQAQNNSKWLVASLSNTSLSIALHRAYILIAVLSLLAIGISLTFGQRLYQAIVSPLRNIINELRLTLSTNSHKELTLKHNSPYTELVETINEMINLQHSSQDEMQHFVEQSTRELRETLETVEIQNIELDIARKNALQASRAKSEFLANTSHELRTPLNGILGFTSLLLKTGLSNQQKDYLATIEQSAQGLLTVINDILDFSKLETGQLTLEYKPILVRELIEEVFAIYAPQAHEKNIRLLSIVNHNVPRNLLGDPQRLKQVLTNLISNAIKFSARGNIVVRGNAVGEMDNQIEIKFSISDNGIGLTEDQQENLFTAFTKVDSSDSRFQGGTGLGLAIAKGLVDRMHGEIGVESESRVGSTFWFTIRLGMDRQRISQSPLMNSLYGVRALIYDANPTGRMEITHLLSSWGVSYIEEDLFKNVHATYDLHQDQTIDLIILDSYTEETNFDRATLIQGIKKFNNSYKTPIILLAPPAIQRIIQDEIVGLSTIIVQRPIAHNYLHQSICNLLSIAEPLKHHGKTPEITQPPLNRPIKILVVDDNAANRKLVCEFLRPLGAITSSAESGFDALALIESQSFDLILMDVQMPGMDGMETTKLIRQKETHKRTPVVALTAHAVLEQKTKLLLAGMDDFLSKPVSEEDLIDTIDRWVKNQPQSKHASRQQVETEQSNLAPPPHTKEIEASESKAQPQVFDWAESMRLSKNKPDLATDMLKMLINGLDETMEGLKNALASNDKDALFEINHKFHGGCCYCGVPAVRQASKTLELQLYNKQFDHIDVLTDQVINEIRTLKCWADDHDLDALFADMDD